MKHSTLILPASIALIAALSGCGSDTEQASAAPEATEAADTFTADVTLTSSTPVTLGYEVGDTCSGMGNGSLEGGKRFTVAAKGETIGHGELPDGVAVSGGTTGNGVDCEFAFTADLPSGLGYYTFDFKSQGYFEASEDELIEGVQMDRIDFEGRR